MNEQPTTEDIILKPSIANFRYSCDLCETSLLNCHWICKECCYEVCIDCYDEKQFHNTVVPLPTKNMTKTKKHGKNTIRLATFRTKECLENLLNSIQALQTLQNNIKVKTPNNNENETETETETEHCKHCKHYQIKMIEYSDPDIMNSFQKAWRSGPPVLVQSHHERFDKNLWTLET